jgi:hypothetical protein
MKWRTTNTTKWQGTDIIFIKRLFEYNGFNSHQYRTSFTNKHFQIKLQQIPNFCTIVIYFDIFFLNLSCVFCFFFIEVKIYINNYSFHYYNNNNTKNRGKKSLPELRKKRYQNLSNAGTVILNAQFVMKQITLTLNLKYSW